MLVQATSVQYPHHVQLFDISDETLLYHGKKAAEALLARHDASMHPLYLKNVVLINPPQLFSDVIQHAVANSSRPTVKQVVLTWLDSWRREGKQCSVGNFESKLCDVDTWIDSIARQFETLCTEHQNGQSDQSLNYDDLTMSPLEEIYFTFRTMVSAFEAESDRRLDVFKVETLARLLGYQIADASVSYQLVPAGKFWDLRKIKLILSAELHDAGSRVMITGSWVDEISIPPHNLIRYCLDMINDVYSTYRISRVSVSQEAQFDALLTQ